MPVVIALGPMNCPECGSEAIVKNGKIQLQDQTPIQKYRRW
jgi:transposase-like protein